MRKIFLSILLLALGTSFALTEPHNVRASLAHQELQLAAEFPPNYLPMVFKTTVAVIYGKVIDASDGSGIADAQVCYQTLCVNTNSMGDYALSGLPSGNLSITVTKHEFLDLTEQVQAQLGVWVYHQFAITRSTLSLGNVFIRTIVTWSSQQYITTPLGTFENDLDAHMWFDNGALSLHLYSGSGEGTNECGAAPNMCLLFDARLGSGPETIDISQLEVNAHYWYGVFNVNQAYDPLNYPNLSQLLALVRLNDDTGTQQTFYAPQGSGNFWFVFEMDYTGLVTIKNCLTTYPGESIPTCPEP